jgi:hypothetical protein
MSNNKAIRKWEQDLIDAYYDYYYHQILDALYEQFQQWKAGELTHEDMDQAIHSKTQRFSVDDPVQPQLVCSLGTRSSTTAWRRATPKL